MDIHIVAAGHGRAGPEQELLEHYRTRLASQGRQAGIGEVHLKEIAEPKRLSGAELKRAEGQRLLDALPAKSRIIVLDEHGKALTSDALAQRLQSWLEGGRDVAIVIGGAEGLSDAVLDAADERIALGPMTWPHLLARVLITEQLYRAATLLTGHPYHRA